jgi:hypothetical protein
MYVWRITLNSTLKSEKVDQEWGNYYIAAETSEKAIERCKALIVSETKDHGKDFTFEAVLLQRLEKLT